MLALEVTARNDTESADALRARGVTPAVLYGPKESPMPIAIDARRLETVWRDAGETTIVTLKGAGHDMDTLIHDVQLHPVTSQILHADFYVLEKGKKITINVPLEFVGEAPAEKLGHILVKALHEIEIEVAPAELPHNLDVDLATLKEVGDHITASQIKLPPSAALITGADEIVASVTAFQEEKAPEALVIPEATEVASPETTETTTEEKK
jgi:large subunit ribosomal protein L25